MKQVLCFSSLIVTILFITGCAHSGNLTGIQQEKAIKKYPRTGLNLQPDDGCLSATAKVMTRTILCPVTLGISEHFLLEERQRSFTLYEEDLKKEAEKKYYNSFIGKKKGVVLAKFGAPTKIAPDGEGGEICIFERSRTVGGEKIKYGSGSHGYEITLPDVQKIEMKIFRFNKQGECISAVIKSENL